MWHCLTLKSGEVDLRFLTEDAKQDVIAEWEATKLRWRSGELCGPGEPDGDIVPWVDRINALPGVCTLQSCAGHRRGRVLDAAHFWLWLSPTVAARFDRNAFLLLNGADQVDWVSRHYLSDGKEIASITFFGNERAMLGQSAPLVYGFLCGIAEPDG